MISVCGVRCGTLVGVCRPLRDEFEVAVVELHLIFVRPIVYCLKVRLELSCIADVCNTFGNSRVVSEASSCREFYIFIDVHNHDNKEQGPNTEPWGTPERTSSADEIDLLTVTA